MAQEVSEIDLRFRRILTEVRRDAGGDFKTVAGDLAEVGYDVSNNTVSNYEDSTTKKIPLEYIDAVCRRYNINHAYFFSADAPKRPTDPKKTERVLEVVRRAVDPTSEDYLEKVLRILRKLPGDDS